MYDSVFKLCVNVCKIKKDAPINYFLGLKKSEQNVF